MEDQNNSSSGIGGLLVSRMVTDNRQQPRFMYREKRVRAEDSGWRIFTGMESEEFLEDPANCAIYHPDTVVAIDPSIDLLLPSGIGSVFEKNESNFWERVTDFKLEDDFMTRQELQGGWELRINNLFERDADELEAFFTTGDKSLRISVWDHEAESREELVSWIREEIAERHLQNEAPLESFDTCDKHTTRLGYMVVEQDGPNVYSVLYAWSIRDGGFAFMSFSFDDPADQDWALETWESVQPASGEGLEGESQQ